MHALARARRAACFMCYYRFGLVRAGARGVTWTGTVGARARGERHGNWSGGRARGGRLLGAARGPGVRRAAACAFVHGRARGAETARRHAHGATCRRMRMHARTQLQRLKPRDAKSKRSI